MPCGSPATLCARPREGRERSWQAVDCPVTPRTEAETTDSGADAGHRRHPWPCAWRVGTGWRVRPRRRDRAPWAGGGPDGGRRGRPETDAHRGIIGRSWPSKSPLRGRYAAPTGRRRPPADPPIRTDPVDPAPPVVSVARRPPTFRFPVAPTRANVDRRPPARGHGEGGTYSMTPHETGTPGTARRHRPHARSAPRGRPWASSATPTSRTTRSGSSGPRAPPAAGSPISPRASAAPRTPPR